MITPVNFVLPAAGLGSRFLEEGFTTPKPLLKLGDLPMIIWVVANSPILPIDTLTIISLKKHNVEKHIASFLVNAPFKVNYLSIDELTDGAARTVALASRKISSDEPLIVINSDQFLPSGYEELVQDLRSDPNFFGSILTMEANDDKWSFIGRTDQGKIDRVVEKKVISSEATVGIYAWSKNSIYLESFEYLISKNIKTNGEYYLAPSYQYLIQNKIEIKTFNLGPLETAFFPLGTPKDYIKFLNSDQFELFLEKTRRKIQSWSKTEIE
jgi:NDP-sugar pyrophosphorylase family protein